jgi:spermidine synthase
MNADDGHPVGAHCVRPNSPPIRVHPRVSAFIRVRRFPATPAAIFLISFAVLGFEISLTRVFSVLLSYHYTFLAVSGAVCGLGLGGFGWHLRIRRHPARDDVTWAALAFALSLPISLLLLFGRWSLLAGHLWAAALPLLPFCFAGAFLAQAFREFAPDSGCLYQADMLGAGLAAVIVVPLIGLGGALHLAFFWGGVVALGAACWALARGDRTSLLAALLTAGLLLASWPLSIRHDLLRVPARITASPAVGKAMVRPPEIEGASQAVVDSEWSAFARTDLVRQDFPQAGLYALQVFTDGDTPSQMTPFAGDLGTLGALRRELPFLGYDLPPRGRLLSIGPGAGRDFLWGMLAGFADMDGVEVNASMARLMARYRRINGDLYHRPGIHVTIDDGRSFIRRSRERYDLIASTLTQTATVGNNGHALVESYLHTKEAFADCFAHLTPDGRYLLVTQSGPAILRAALTALAVMERRGVAAPEACRHLAVFALTEAAQTLTPYRYLLVWKRSPLTAADVAHLRQAAAGVAEVVFVPGGDGSGPLDRIAAGTLAPEDIAAAGLRDGAARVDVRPATDDRPFFFDLSFGVPPALKWFLLGGLVTAALYSAVLLAQSPRRDGAGGRWAAYFAALGAGFMLVEVPLAQKLILFLGRPTVSLAAILFFLLAGAGVGSRLSQRWSAAALPRAVSAAAAAACGLVVLYTATFAPALGALLFLPAWAKLAVVGVLVLPLGLVLGVPFPSGIRLLSRVRQDDVPWMWGVSGMTSVVGSAFAAAGAKSIGFSGCLLVAALLYGLVALLAPRLPLAAPVAAEPRARSAVR